MPNRTIILLFLTALCLCNFSAFAQTTTIYLVRHAEKLTTDLTDRDPGLTPEGLKRADDLAKLLKKKNISAIYSTNYKRTLSTATPLSAVISIAPQTYAAKDLPAFANQVLQDNKGKTILVVGHSNTLIPIARALKCQTPFDELTDDDYDMLLKVTIDESGKALLSIGHYGAFHHVSTIPPAYLFKP